MDKYNVVDIMEISMEKRKYRKKVYSLLLYGNTFTIVENWFSRF